MASGGWLAGRVNDGNAKWWVLGASCFALFMAILDNLVVNVAIPTISEDFSSTTTQLQWIVSAYTLVFASLQITAGGLGDRFGRKRFFLIGVVIFTSTSALAALVQNTEWLIVARAVQGFGAAFIMPLSLSLISAAFPPEERGKALGIWSAVSISGLAFGPIVGGVIVQYFAWQWIFLINVPIGIACLGITVTHVQESRDPAAHRIDWAGQGTLAGGLFLLVLALLRGNDQGWTSAAIITELGAAAALLVAFVAVERKVREPMLPLGLFRVPSFTGAQLAAFAISGSFFAVFLYPTLYLQQILGLSAIEAGLVYVPGTVVMFGVSAATANLSAKVHPGVLVSGGLALVSAGMILMSAMTGVDSSWTAVVPGTILAMIGTGLFNPAVIAVALGATPADQSGLAAGVEGC